VNKIPLSIFCLLLTCAACVGQSSYKGLTPGTSTRADVERALGEPTNKLTDRLLEYEEGGQQIYVQYSKESPTAIRILVTYSPPSTRSDVLHRQGLPQVADARRTNKQGALEEYFGSPSYIVLTYDENSKTEVTQVGYLSRDLFESVVLN
jgi:hypothetical protein